nr:P-loop NTPase [Niabella hibiscisoli]
MSIIFFGKQGAQKLAEQYELPFLGEIPLVQSIREGGDIGIPVMVSDDELSKKAFRDLAKEVEQRATKS